MTEAFGHDVDQHRAIVAGCLQDRILQIKDWELARPATVDRIVRAALPLDADDLAGSEMQSSHGPFKWMLEVAYALEVNSDRHVARRPLRRVLNRDAHTNGARDATVAGQSSDVAFSCIVRSVESNVDRTFFKVVGRNVDEQLGPLEREAIGEQSDRRTDYGQGERAHREGSCYPGDALVERHRGDPNQRRHGHRAGGACSQEEAERPAEDTPVSEWLRNRVPPLTQGVPRTNTRLHQARAYAAVYTRRDVDKRHILREITRVADANGGRPPGQRLFRGETGIAERDWRGRYWARWSDALKDAGYEPNVSIERYERDQLIEALIGLIRRYGRFPTWAELGLERRANPKFPSIKGLAKWLGNHADRVHAVADYCDEHPGNDDILEACRSAAASGAALKVEGRKDREGSVYLIKSGQHYKIGRAFALGRRGREIQLQLPERAVTLHVIQTDDPIGIEAYWHKRFEAKRANGEWFELSDADVRAFRRRKSFM